MGTEPDKVHAEERARYAKHKDKRNAARKMREENPGVLARIRASQAKHEAENKERVRAAKLAWHANHRAKHYAHVAAYWTRKKSAPGRCTTEQMRARIAMFGGKCWVPGCGKDFEAVDHVIPLAGGGSNWPANLRPICWSHNSVKGARSWRRVA